MKIVVEDIDGEAICDNGYGTDQDCMKLKKLKKMISSQEKIDKK